MKVRYITTKCPYYNNLYLNLFDQLLQIVVLQLAEAFHVSEIHRIIALAVRADILVNKFGFALQNADAPAMEPILALVTANVEL